MCLGIVVILSTSRQYNQFNTLIKCSTFLEVYYLQITQQASVTQSTLQAQKVFIPQVLPTYTGNKTLDIASLNTSSVTQPEFPTTFQNIFDEFKK